MKNLKFKILVCLILPFTLYILHSPPAFAEDASTAAQLRDSVKTKVAEELAQIKKAVSKKAFLGTIASKNEASLSISNYLGQNRTALVSTDTAIKLKSGADGTPADLKTGDNILIMGDVDSNGNMTAKRLLVIATPVVDKRTTAYGKVTAAGASVTVGKLTAKLASDTNVTTTKDGKTAKLKTTDIKVGHTVVLITKASTTIPVVTDLYVFPGSATSSATPTP
jgi:hypothetical protein